MSDATSIGHKPAGKWEFDESVTEVFDDMLKRSIPQYDVMREIVTTTADQYLRRQGVGGPKHRGSVLDLGSSRGESIAVLLDAWGPGCMFTLVEISEPMLEVLEERFAGYSDMFPPIVRICPCDLRTEFPAVAYANVVLAVLTLQFVPIEYRQTIVQKSYDCLDNGGAMIVVEKVLGSTASINAGMVDQYLDRKRAAGYSQDEINRKRLSLEGSLVSITAEWNEELLRKAGFSSIDCIWRWNNFAAWVAVK